MNATISASSGAGNEEDPPQRLTARGRRRSDRRRDSRTDSAGGLGPGQQQAPLTVSHAIAVSPRSNESAAPLSSRAALLLRPDTTGISNNLAALLPSETVRPSVAVNFAELLMVNSESPLPYIDFLAGFDSGSNAAATGVKFVNSSGPGSRYTEPPILPRPVAEEEDNGKKPYPLIAD